MDFNSFSNAPSSPPTKPVVITTDADEDLPSPVRGIYVGVTGDLTVVAPNGATITYENIVAGVWHPITAVRVMATGTDATGLIGAQ